MPTVYVLAQIALTLRTVGGLTTEEIARRLGVDTLDEPIVFMKAANTVVGPNDDLHLPPGSRKMDWEVELGVVIGAYLRSPRVI